MAPKAGRPASCDSVGWPEVVRLGLSRCQLVMVSGDAMVVSLRNQLMRGKFRLHAA
jgi:hypothetical protein